jgi:hypothetical protein
MASTLKNLFSNNNPMNRVEILSFNGKKFRIEVKHRNGDPLGFNDNCCLKIMNDNGTFSNIADNITVGIEYKNFYYLNPKSQDNLAKIELVNSKAIAGFKEFIKKVYA